ncbi:hypothetical protein L3X38_037579 [Prunus dulcis]|uniref:Integrase catalytic domain-containing protein n=1 Tax=Prunus dulcis TaxID=3755 RepID=A0AAD4YPP2_PRUDU|nr:hypothetical protein L3X38_037579 [Prunus dulcis]
MPHDSMKYVKRCNRCQRSKLIPSLPTEVYHPQNNPWQFIKCAIDLVGSTSSAPTKKDMMIVATDYFTKLIKSLVIDNRAQFIGKQITVFFAKYGIKENFSTLRYPQGKGQAEASNKIVLDCLKKRLEGTEVIIPSHISVPYMSIEVGSIDQNCEQMKVNLDLLEEEREITIVRVAAY